jgi:hypothetical protein
MPPGVAGEFVDSDVEPSQRVGTRQSAAADASGDFGHRRLG